MDGEAAGRTEVGDVVPKDMDRKVVPPTVVSVAKVEAARSGPSCVP